jgi:hypothetical protein
MNEHVFLRFSVRVALSLLALLVLSPANVFSGIIQLPGTGQVKCYNWQSPWEEIDCLGTGQDGMYRMGVNWPEPRFTITYRNSAGQCPDPGVDCDGNASNDIMRDNLTGLVWPRDGNPPNDTLYWNEAIDFANNLTLCGQTDWRLPNIIELESLLNAGTDTPTWLNTTQGFLNVQYIDYWSSTTAVYFWGNRPWVVSNGFSVAVPSAEANHAALVWSVRSDTAPPAQLWKTGQTQIYRTGDDGDLKSGVAWPDPRFTVDGDCAIDNLTGLMWSRNANLPNGPITWKQALDYIGNISFCGYSDWRLPNRKELRSLVDHSQMDVYLPTGHPFTNVDWTGGVDFWSSNSYLNPQYAWYLEIGLGYIWHGSKNTPNYVWPVRTAVPSGTIGTEGVVYGTGFGTKKGKVLIGGFAAKVVTWEDDKITGLLKKVPLSAGTYDVIVMPQPYKTSPRITFPYAFTVIKPQIGLHFIHHGTPGTEITAAAMFLGTKKGKAYLEYLDNGQPKKKNCKVTSWTMDPSSGVSEIRFVVPKLNSGDYTLKVTNKVGMDQTTFTVEPPFTITEAQGLGPLGEQGRF